MSRDEATKRYVERLNKDRDYDWRVELNFYGKVVDENNQPVPGARVNLDWNTDWDPIKAPQGTAFAETSSDGNGMFSLLGQHGKILGVKVGKAGYYSVEAAKGILAFEYANPSDQNYYEPDSNAPVVFHLRKKGEGAKLVNKTVKLSLSGKAEGGLDLMSGQITSTGSLQIQSNKPEFKSARGRYPWSVTLSMPSGGLIETNEQLPFTAPESGYTQTAVMDMTNPDTPTWGNGAMKTYYFYLPGTNTYGLMHVNTLGASSHVYLNYSYNSTPGDRNLEPSSDRQLKAP